jgi:hypothetical protein
VDKARVSGPASTVDAEPGCGGHPQQPAPEAIASALAVAPQQLPDSWASAAVPQHVPAVAGAGEVDIGAELPQQPPVALSASLDAAWVEVGVVMVSSFD